MTRTGDSLAPRGSRLLPPIRSVREMELAIAPGSPADGVLDAIAAGLKRNGNRVKRLSDGSLAFRRFFGTGGLPLSRAAGMVSGGTVTIERAGAPRVRVELRYSRWFTFVFPALAVGAIVLTTAAPAMRAGAIAVLAGMLGLNCALGRAAYEGLIRDSARGATRTA